jgi:hypothetical protein
LGRDEASQGVQPRRLDLEDDADPPQLMMTGGQVQGQGHQQGEERALVPLNRDGMGLDRAGSLAQEPWTGNGVVALPPAGSIRSGMLV